MTARIVVFALAALTVFLVYAFARWARRDPFKVVRAALARREAVGTETLVGALRPLAAAPPPETAAVLAPLAHDADPRVRELLVTALEHAGGDDAEILLNRMAQDDPDGLLRSEAADAADHLHAAHGYQVG